MPADYEAFHEGSDYLQAYQSPLYEAPDNKGSHQPSFEAALHAAADKPSLQVDFHQGCVQ